MERIQAIETWLKASQGLTDFELRPASSDASFRRYFRISYDDQSLIVMDAPPDKEDSQAFIHVSGLLAKLGLNVPEVLAVDAGQGFLLLTDLGSRCYLDELNVDSVERLYGDALSALLVMQACGPQHHAGETPLPPYDAALLHQEMQLFRQWFLDQQLKTPANTAQNDMLDEVFALLTASALEQPQVMVHRDYHSRNLMVRDSNNPGILDFQDAVIGPVTYDLVSLLRDCYVAWPDERVQDWVLGYHELATQSGVLRGHAEAQFLRWFDLMGIQRHLKATGIFARLNMRDNKPGFLKDIPRTLGYVLAVSGRYPELAAFHEYLNELFDSAAIQQLEKA